MRDPFNTTTEAALRDERNDLDPFMAEHYAANAQHELDRALAVSPPDQQRIAHVRRLLGSYHAIAALAQLPDESDFGEDAAEETVQSADLAQMHPDRLALMRSGGDEADNSSSSALGRSSGAICTNNRNDVVAADDDYRSDSNESSVEFILRHDGLDDGVRGQQSHFDREHLRPAQSYQPRFQQSQVLQRQLPQQHIFQQQVPQQQVPQQWAPPPVYYPPQQTIQYYQPPPQPVVYYQPPPQPMSLHPQSNFAALSMAFVQNTTQYNQPGNINFIFSPTYIYSGPPLQHMSTVPQPEHRGQDQDIYDRGCEEIIRGGNSDNDGSRARRRRNARKSRRRGRD